MQHIAFPARAQALSALPLPLNAGTIMMAADSYSCTKIACRCR